MKSTTLFGTLLLVPALSWAQQNCDSPRDDFDGIYCLNKVYSQTDSELNDVYRDLSSKLAAGDRTALRNRQREWIDQRNASCSRHIEAGFFVNLRCATETTKQPLQVLQERLRECKSSGCQPSKL